MSRLSFPLLPSLQEMGINFLFWRYLNLWSRVKGEAALSILEPVEVKKVNPRGSQLLAQPGASWLLESCREEVLRDTRAPPGSEN